MIERLDAISASAAGARQALASMKATLIILREDVSRLSSER
jgi:hypothetical protein